MRKIHLKLFVVEQGAWVNCLWFALRNLHLLLWSFCMDLWPNVFLWKLREKEKKDIYIYLESCFNSSICIDWHMLKSSTARFRISRFARLEDLKHTKSQECDLKKRGQKKELETRETNHQRPTYMMFLKFLFLLHCNAPLISCLTNAPNLHDKEN